MHEVIRYIGTSVSTISDKSCKGMINVSIKRFLICNFSSVNEKKSDFYTIRSSDANHKHTFQGPQKKKLRGQAKVKAGNWQSFIFSLL